MFEAGLFEMLVIGVVALVVLGPERLPVVARTAGHLLGRFRRYANQVKSDITREMQVEEFAKMKSELEGSARGFQQNLSELESGMNQASMHEADRLHAEAEQRRMDAVTAADLEHAAQTAEQSAHADAQALANHLAQPGDVPVSAHSHSHPHPAPTSKATDV